jgi:hypothetical protein
MMNNKGIMMEDLTEPEMDALLDVLEYDTMAEFNPQEAEQWTWCRPGLEYVKMELKTVREFVKKWKGM